MTFAAQFVDMMPDTVEAVPGHDDGLGGWVASGEVIVSACRVEGQLMRVPGPGGSVTVSTIQLILPSAPGLTTDGHRYNVPGRFRPGAEVRAVGVEKESDEAGECYEVVLLP